MFGAAVGAVRELCGGGHDLRRPGANGDRDGRLAAQIRRVLLHHAGCLLHFGVRVDDHEPAHAVVLDDVDDALVGQIRHDEIGQGAQRRIGLERARELLADRRQEAQRAASAAFRVVDAGAFERIRALLAQGDRERPLLVVEDVPALEAEPECAERGLADAQRHRRGGRTAAPALGEAGLALALAQEDRRAEFDCLADRRAPCQRKAAPAADLGVREARGRHHLDGRAVVGGQRDHAAVGSQQGASFAQRDVVDGIGGQRARERGREVLEPCGPLGRAHRASAGGGLRCADEADRQLGDREGDQADGIPRPVDLERVIRRHEVVPMRDQRKAGRDQAGVAAAGERRRQHEQQEHDRGRGRTDGAARMRRQEHGRDQDAEARRRGDGELPVPASGYELSPSGSRWRDSELMQ